MTSKHKALIIEDDAETAEDLAEILTALEFESTIVDNKQQAASALGTGVDALCLVILDLEIKATPSSLRGNIENGKSLLRDIRRLRPDVGADGGHWLPIVVVSGHAREADEAVEAMRDGASDVIQKPPKIRDVSARVREALNRAGRTSHAGCHVVPTRTAPLEGPVVVNLSAQRNKRRCRVILNSRAAELTEASLTLFLRLLVAQQAGKGVHKSELGASNDKGFKGVSRLREELEPALGERDVVRNDQHGNYQLVDEVELAGCDAAALRKFDNAEITELAAQLKVRRSSAPRKV